MYRFHKILLLGDEIEISFCTDLSSWAIPFQLQWRFMHHDKVPKGHVQSISYITFQFLCFVVTYDQIACGK